ncbi:F-box only protein 6-like [Empidonax traillii]|uniref:F-box only protein 6-like n=1 Tax=Empidonax traillii TaxID=164674 RepID=UPI000FFD4229|nr:F-box only protein 6-like [Empidonax traillii]
MTTIGDLPEDVLVQLLSLLPAQDLLRNCRLVCSQWRYVVDLNTLWKRKCQRDGFYEQSLDRNVSDWRVFYMLCRLKRNLIKNPCAEEKFQHWTIDRNDGDEWRIEQLPGANGTMMPDPTVQKYFATSFGLCLKSQLITLQNEGYGNQLMDEIRPEIIVKDWYAARSDCGCRYELTVRLLSADHIVLEEFHPEPVIIEQWNDAKWREISHTFQNYPAGVRHIYFQHGGQDTQFWAGWYGVRVTNTSITIGPHTLL